jgi:hypothetical protein
MITNHYYNSFLFFNYEYDYDEYELAILHICILYGIYICIFLLCVYKSNNIYIFILKYIIFYRIYNENNLV